MHIGGSATIRPLDHKRHARSDGEAFVEGFRRLGLGKVIGIRTSGGEIWLTMSNGCQS